MRCSKLVPAQSILRVGIAAAFLAVTSAAAVADQLAELAAVPGDDARAFQLSKPLAEQAELGDAGAQFTLGAMYLEGRPVAVATKNYREAVKWFRKAAEQGFGKAQWGLSVMYHEGKGVTQDYAEAMQWLRKAAEQGLGDAQRDLGQAYEGGSGVAVCCSAADGQSLFANNESKNNNITALMWYILASAQDTQDATEKRDHLASEMTQSQIAEAQRLAREWKPTASRSSGAVSQAGVGTTPLN